MAERGPELCLCVGMMPPEEEGQGEGDEAAAEREELVRERTLW